MSVGKCAVVNHLIQAGTDNDGIRETTVKKRPERYSSKSAVGGGAHGSPMS